MRKILSVLLVIALSGCLPNEKVSLERNGVQFVASINEYDGEMEHAKFKVNGKISITNNSQNSVSYSNKDLYLVIEKEGESRTYMNSPASHNIDLSTVEIPANENREYQVYWVLPPVKSLKAERIRLEWRQ
jgi:hypothetical protein